MESRICLWNACSLANKLSGFQSLVYSSSYDMIMKSFCANTTFFVKTGNLEGVVYWLLSILSFPLGLSPPAADYYSSLFLYLNFIASKRNIIIMGDFNFPDINWCSLTSSSSLSSQFCDLLFDCNLAQLTTSETHVNGNILDLVIASDPDQISNFSISPTASLPVSSDHHLITFSISRGIQHSPLSSYEVLHYSKADLSGLNDYLLDYDFSAILSHSDVEYVWHQLKEILSEAIPLFVPKVKLRSYQRPKWFTSEIQHSLNRIHSLRKKVRKSPSPYNCLNFLPLKMCCSL